MKPSEALKLHRDVIRSIVLKNDALNPRIFGSTARGDDGERSDLDILVDPIPLVTSILSLIDIEEQVSLLTGVRVDVQTPMSLPERFRSTVLQEAQAL